jgi:hypothetical protein
MQLATWPAAYPIPAKPDLKSGLAVSTKGRIPMNGLRHPVEGGTTGWYIWFGEDFSNDADFFAPMHTSHIYDEYPAVIKLLGLPPGYRFLIADNHLDVWYDASLLDV